MAKFIKLPENLKEWKITSLISENNGCEVYKASKKEFDGAITQANLCYVNFSKSAYDSENVNFINDEASFLKNLSKNTNMFNYIDIVVNNNPAKEKIELFIISEDLKSLGEIVRSKPLSDAEIVDFGIQLSTILEKLEQDNIFHGNINLENIFVTSDGKYKLGGFSDFEGKISDMSFVAPEIYKKENPDFTTDIYSLGLIMYFLSNNNKLPFENDTTDKNAAIKQRFEGKSVSAPVNGSEKLKSVIVIACQANNANRWKNAGNIKNALTAIKNELPVEKSAATANVIVPESTEFEGNVFEEYDYDSFEEAIPAENILPETNQEEVIETPVNSDETETIENTTEVIEEMDIKTNSDFDEVAPTETESTDNDFDIIDVKPENENNDIKADNNNEVPPIIGISDNDVSETKKPFSEKDYGDFFEEEESATTKKKTNDIKTEKVEDDSKENLIDIELGENAFTNSEDETENTSKKGTAVIIVSIIIMLIALGFIAFCIVNGKNNPDNTTQTTQSTVQQTTEFTDSTVETTIPQTTAAPTTVEPTTVEPTTEASSQTNVIPVVGYGYSYGKKLLEQAGFIVEIGEYSYSTEYDAGYIIAQSPEGDIIAEKGSVITLDISLGIEEESTEAIEDDSDDTPQVQTNGNYIFSGSDSSYISAAEVNNLSREELNLALNEIYARRGRIFKDATLSAYFNSKSWYTPLYTADEFSQNVTLNKYEQANLQLIIDEQKERGYR